MFAARNAFLTAAAATAPDTGTARASIVLPNPGRVVYPVLPVLRQAMQGGKTPQRLSAADDPTKGAMTSIILPNASSLVYPVLGVLRQPHTGSQIITPPRTPLFDAVGAGAAAAGTTFTFNITFGPLATACVVGMNFDGNTASPTASAQVGSTAMTQLKSILGFWAASGSDQGSIFMFGLLGLQGLGLAGTTQTVTVTTSSANTNRMNAVSYNNVSSFGTPVSLTGSGSTASHTVTAPPGQMVSQMFSIGFSLLLSNYNQTTRYASPSNQAMILGDAATAGASTLFTAALSSSSTWGSIALPLIP